MLDSISYLDPSIQFVLFSVLKILVAFAVVMTMVAYSVLVERKVSAWIQDRVGPNRASPFFIDYIPIIGPFLVRAGIFQPLADGLKSFLKEDFTPNYVRKVYFWLAPAIAVIPALLTIAVIPFGSVLGNQKMVIADLNVGILYTFGIVSLGVYGIVLAGYAANSKYPFLGGIRASAQMISYEIAMGMSVIVVFLIVGNLNLTKVVEYQRDHGWLAFPFFAKHFSWESLVYWPLSLLAFAIFLISAFAETNRLPFDLPESETELVG
ncbi:MAG TPA: complex I subunit 1 family protein, partial [Candidatus Limnocylindria bacterium]|nr:complex I subunit 1 family protein [Candidatus Limnocylindria bacterium]